MATSTEDSVFVQCGNVDNSTRIGIGRVLRPVMSLLLLTFSVSHCSAGFLSSAGSSSVMTQQDQHLESFLSVGEVAVVSDGLGAGIWGEADAPSYASASAFPRHPDGRPILVVSGATGFAGSTGSRSLTGQTRVTSGGGAPAAFCTPSARLALPLLRYQYHRTEFLFIPDSPPCEVFRPPPAPCI